MFVFAASAAISGGERRLYTVQWRGERCYHFAGFECDIGAQRALHVMAAILALADYLGGFSGDPADWPYAASCGFV